MVDVGINIANNLKAKNFMGTLSIRNGLFFIAIQQFLLGVSLYSVIHYLHPSLTKLAWLLFGVNAISAVLGFLGALKRSMVIECVYLVFYFISLTLVFLTVLDMAELVHLLPKAPQIRDVSDFGALRSAAFLRAGGMKPHVFLRQRDMPLDLGEDDFSTQGDDDLEINPDDDSKLRNDGHNALPTDVDIAPLRSPDLDRQQEISPAKQQRQHVVDESGRSDVATPAAVATNNAEGATVDSDLRDLEANRNATTTTAPKRGRDNANVHVPKALAAPTKENEVTADSLPAQAEVADSVEPAKEPNAEDAKMESFYDRLPLVPHLGETEGEAEEVSKEELPPETHDLTPEGISEVVAIYKIQKRPLKMAAAGLTTMALLFNIYCYWVAVTFVLNKCTCLDELVSHPEQFTPLID
ncbi:hypothetical protein, conserved [Babesia bigemina]|uniref:Transmembrane protein n=1 Tax=Babesia bigemina TaxID=5866 RepID=A0A061D5C3_BABBI|nr:hypothetical protein, conserved [Babesia bigemina]CDR95896.1 hypothetical protein, conserved [Babesia bigemina]|eukprot:XP_012768082.1 hypothetical protein, conserved [Babesia bigemina]